MKLGLNPDPLAAFRRSGYAEKILKERSVPLKPGKRVKAQV